MEGADIRHRQIVRVTHLSPGVRILASQEYLDARREGAVGTVFNLHWEDTHVLAWVRHGNTLAPYYNYELRLVGEPCD